MQVSEIEMLVYNPVSCVEFLNQEPIARNCIDASHSTHGFVLEKREEGYN